MQRPQIVDFVSLRFELLLYNARPLILTELLYLLVSSAIFGPLAWWVFDKILLVSGFSYLSLDNAAAFFRNPLTIVFIAALLVLVCIFALIDISAAIFIFECSRERKKATVKSTVAFSLRNAVRAAQPKNLGTVPVTLVLIPIVGSGASSSFIKFASFPNQLMSYITSNPWAGLAFVAVLGAMLFLSTRWMFAFHYFTLEQVDFTTALRKSGKLARGNRIKNLVSMLIVQAFIWVANAAVVAISTQIASASVNLLGKSSAAGIFAFSLILFATLVLNLVVIALSAPTSCLKMSALFYDRKESTAEGLAELAYTPSPNSRQSQRAFIIGTVSVSLFAVACCSLIIMSITRGITASPLQLLPRMEVIGYQGSPLKIPGNTLASLQKAVDEGADSCVVDVQISRDGVAFLMDGTDLFKVTSLHGDIRELDFEEIGSSSVRPAGMVYAAAQPFATLGEALDLAKELDCGLIADVSDLDYRNDALDIVIATIAEHDCFDCCRIASESYDDIVAIKDREPALSTIYIIDFAFGDLSAFACADAFALDGAGISSLSVEQLHNNGRKVYAWNIANTAIIDNLIDAHADGFSTTLVDKAASIAERRGFPEAVYRVLTLID